MRIFLFFTLLTLVAAADKDKHKSSSIDETESHRHVKESYDESNSGISESGLSKSPSSSESESEVKVTKKRILVKKKKEKDETVEEKKTSLKKVVRSSKFPLQFATKKLDKPSSEYDEDATTVDKKIYKDVGYRKDKFKERSLKEKRRDTTTNPNKKKKPKTTQKPTKKRHYTGYNALENASDLNYPTGLFSSPSVPVSPGEDILNMFTINETVTAILNKQEIQVDHAKAGEILKDLKKKYHDAQKELPTDERSEYVNFSKRSDNSIFNNSTLLDGDSGYDDEEYDTEEEDESKGKAKHTKHRKDSEEDEEELTTKEKDRRKAAQYSTKEKEDRTIQLFNILRNGSNISVPSQERLHHRKIILDTLREQGEDVNSENDIVSHYDSHIEEKDERKPDESGVKRTQPKQSTTTEKKGPLWSIEQAYKRAVKSQKNESEEEHFDGEGKSKGYERIPIEKVLDKARESRENKKWIKKFNGTTTTKKINKEGKWTPRPQGSGERKRKEIKEAPDTRDRKRYDSRERGRGRYGEPRERYGDRGDRGDRYKPRYDSRQRYGDRGRFDSRERGRYGDRGPPRYDRGPPAYDRDRYDRGDRYGRDKYNDRYRGRDERGRYGDKPRYEDRGERRGYYEKREGGRYEGRREEGGREGGRFEGRREGGRFEGRREGGRFERRREEGGREGGRFERRREEQEKGDEGKKEEGVQDAEGVKREERPARPPRRDDTRRHKPSRERQVKKKWFSEETESKAALAPGPGKQRPTERGAANLRNGGRNRMNQRARVTEDSFARDYHSFAGNDEKNSEYQKVLKSNKLNIPISDEIVHIP